MNTIVILKLLVIQMWYVYFRGKKEKKKHKFQYKKFDYFSHIS